MRHIYIHVPFCARRCAYCDFAIAVRKRIPHERFVSRILTELEDRRESPHWDRGPVETIYLGGGTPSMLEADQIRRLLHAVVEGGKEPTEITIEANPDDVTLDRARNWHAAGVNRVSLGAQSFHPGALTWMHRTHRTEATAEAVTHLRTAGIGSISLDLMFGLPTNLGREFERDLDAALELEPDHLSVYGLTVESQTPLWRWVDRGSVRVAGDAQYEREFLLAHRVLTGGGFEHYEISNYARPGRRSRHNSAYWTGRPYGGLGPSAHSLFGNLRRWNVREWAQYERAMDESGDPTGGTELLTEAQRSLEAAFLGLRTAEGIPWEGADGGSQLESLERMGWVERSGGRLRLTPSGWLRTDALIPRLTTSPEGG